MKFIGRSKERYFKTPLTFFLVKLNTNNNCKIAKFSTDWLLKAMGEAKKGGL